MKSILLILGLSGSVAFAQTPTVSFNFDGNLTSEAGTTNLVPSGGTPTYTYDRFGNANSACDLFSTSGEIQLEAFISSTFLPFANSPRTFSFWVHYIGHNTDNGNEVNLVRQGAASATGSVFSLRQTGKSVHFLGNGSDVTPPSEDVFRFDSNNWYHYVVAFDGTEIAIYRNGNLVAQEAPSPINTSLFTSNTSFVINPTGSINTNGFGFIIDDLDIFDVSLTEQQVHDMYLQDTPLNQLELIGYFPFNANTAFYNVMGTDQFAQDGSTPSPALAYGYNDLGLHFSSGSIFSNTTLLSEIDGSFTVAYWQRRNQAPVQSYETSVEMGASAFDRAYYSGSAHRDNFGLANGTAPNWNEFITPEQNGTPESYIIYGEWQHHALVLDTLANTYAYYVDGELRKKLGIPPGVMHLFTNKITLGGGTDGSGNVQSVKSCTNFDLDEFYLFNRPLSQPEIMALRYQYATPIVCPTGDVTVTTQQEVNDLWSCQHITGNLTIDDGPGSDIIDLSPLDGVLMVDGNIVIQNLDMTSISPLNGLTALGGSITFQNNASATGISGFASLAHIPGDLTVTNNAMLTYLHGFTILDKIGTDSTLGAFTISDNPAIDFLFEFGSLDTITSSLTIQNAPVISDNISAFSELDYAGSLRLAATGFNQLTAFSNLSGLGNALRIQSNNDLMNLSGLDNVIAFDQTGGTIEIIDNLQVQDLDELSGIDFNLPQSITIDNNANLLNINGLSSISGDLGTDGLIHIANNPMLGSLSGLALITGTSTLSIINNDVLLSLAGLNGITHINTGTMPASVTISQNGQLSNLGGLDNLSTFANNCPLVISENPQLMSISALNNLDVTSLSSVEIQDNLQLAICNELWLCTYLGGSSINATIGNNDVGCQSENEIVQACDLGLNENASPPEVSVYPNPADASINIYLSIGSVEKVWITDISGNNVLEATTSSVTVSCLPAGVYYVHVLTSSDFESVDKLIKL